ncbi:MAG: response regulator [Sphingobacteriaceae bacterium]|jgi:CheY-like chemotaxis protein
MKSKKSIYKYNYIMLLDDDELVNFINQKVMETCSFSKNIYVNTSAISALEFIKNLVQIKDNVNSLLPEVIFIDINMPLMDGFQFIKSFETINSPKLKDVKLVILTSSVHDLDRLKAEEINKNISFLNKPLTVDMLKEI